MSVLVIGEAVVDVVRTSAVEPVETHPGGSPLNVAVGLQRLGVAATLHSSFGDDEHGKLIAAHLARSGVTVTPGSIRAWPTSVAEATLGPDGAASYRFDIEWNPAPISTSGFDLVHTGSIGAALEPGAARVEQALAATEAMVSFDPNVRQALMGDRDVARARVERIVALSDIVKASDEDVAWLYPDAAVAEVLARWHTLGPRLVVVTRGGDGADAVSAGGEVHVDAPATTVADTIGAGDSFMAGLLAAVLEHGVDDVEAAVRFAARCAAITVSRPGADPPARAELIE